MELIITNADQLQTFITEAVKSALSIHSGSFQPTAQPDFLTETAACEFLANCSKHTLYKLVKEGKIKRIRLGQRRTAYSRADLTAYLNRGAAK